jgi:acyl-CoA reductase-like NAD-dependent aldehyde dehydrogenase
VTSRPTLLLIDVQEDFLARPGLTPDRSTIVATLAAMLEHARASGWHVIHVHTRVDPTLADAMPHRRDAGNAEVIAGTRGAEPPTELAPRENEPRLFKRFFSAFDAPGLGDLLRSIGAEPLVVCGVHSHACIRDTVSDAYARGFKVVIPDGATASYDSAHASLAMEWMGARSARTAPLRDFIGDRTIGVEWAQRDPCDESREIQRVALTSAEDVRRSTGELAARQASLAATSIEERRRRLCDWREQLSASSGELRDALVRDIAKPQRDADGELAYGMALLADVLDSLSDHEQEGARQVRYRPRGVVGLITPWNNPFAIPIGKIAPAIGYGNAVIWKPALPATRISELLLSTLIDSGLGDWVALVPGDSGTGDAVVADDNVTALSFTGSVPVGMRLIARAGVRRRPAIVQAELGGSNAAIVDSSADIDAAAADLAAAMFSFSGQRCTAVRRVAVMDDVADAFTERLVAAIQSLNITLPEKPQCDIGPVIDRKSQMRLLGGIELATRDGGKILCGGKVPAELPPAGCWIEPTLIGDLGADHILNQDEWFGPIATLTRTRSFDEALSFHNDSRFGLLGALYATDEGRIAQFQEKANAGILSVGRARPAFSAAGPFNGWKSSGYGTPEHGRWNRDFYCQVQAVYGA